MEELKLPIITKELPAGKRLTMDEYVKFVFLNLKYTANKKDDEKYKRSTAVTTPFSL